MKRWLYLVHRWLGIALCLVMALWFLSGVVMMYVGYPKLTPAERLQGLPPLQVEGCCVPLAQALAAAGFNGRAEPARQADRRGNRPGPDSWRLTSVAGAPRFVFGDAQRQVAVDALSGQRITSVNADDALASARHFAGGVPGRHVAQVSEDAWTHSRALDAHRPLHVVAVDDAADNWLYVSSRTGEVVRDASFTERSWGWIGAWLHWLYIVRGGPLDSWWTDLITVLSLAGTLGAVTGAVIGVMRWRFKGRFKSGRRTPYAGFVERWHHILGLVGGLLCITWVLSGLFSVNPWQIFNAPGPKPDRQAYAGGPLQPDAAPAAAEVLARLQAQGLPVRELQWRRLGGTHDVLALGAQGSWVVDAHQVHLRALPDARWRSAVAALLPGARAVVQQRLTQHDRWYYAREPHTMTGQNERPLPAWRLQFDDDNDTWVTIDERTGAIVQISDGHRRVDRWLFAFLHSFDLPALLASRPAWDVGMVVFSLAGLGLSLTGVVTGWRRLRRKVQPPRRAPPWATLSPHDAAGGVTPPRRSP